MDKKSGDRVEKALQKMIDLIDHDEVAVFSKDEADSLRELIQVWRNIKAVVTVGTMLGNTLKWTVGLTILIASVKSGFFDWIKSGVR